MRQWHPLLASVEVEPGHWEMHAQTGGYAVVQLIEVGHERGYRVVTFDPPRTLVGYYTTLRAACEAAHAAYVRAHGPDPSTVGYPQQRREPNDMASGPLKGLPANSENTSESVL